MPLENKVSVKFNVLVFIGNYEIFKNSLLPKIVKLYQYFDKSKFCLYCCVNNKFSSKTDIDELLKSVLESNNLDLSYYLIETINKGADIGGFFQLIKKVIEIDDDSYNYNIFIHTKSKDLWRESLLSILEINYLKTFEERVLETKNIGIYGCHRWLNKNKRYSSNKELKLSKKETRQTYEKNFKLVNSLFQIDFTKKNLNNYCFISGTIFIFNSQLIEFIRPKIDECYELLPSYDHWRPSGKDIIGFEYTFERWFGALSYHLGLLVTSEQGDFS